MMRKRGQPSKFESWMPRVAEVVYRLGGRDEDAAEALGVSRATVQEWRSSRPDFARTNEVRAAFDAQVVRALHQRATGYETRDGVHVPGHPTAQIFWLKNRKPKDWRDKVDVEHSGKVKIENTDQAMAQIVIMCRESPVMIPVVRKALTGVLDQLPQINADE